MKRLIKSARLDVTQVFFCTPKIREETFLAGVPKGEEEFILSVDLGICPS